MGDVILTMKGIDKSFPGVHALDHVDLEVRKGEVHALMGENGAGKSTLLKVISGIMEPTSGWVRREGTIAALLELGSGFDGDLTVKENAYLRGAMLGYTKEFMDETYEQIIEILKSRLLKKLGIKNAEEKQI